MIFDCDLSSISSNSNLIFIFILESIAGFDFSFNNQQIHWKMIFKNEFLYSRVTIYEDSCDHFYDGLLQSICDLFGDYTS